jgi:hypothetical protein
MRVLQRPGHAPGAALTTEVCLLHRHATKLPLHPSPRVDQGLLDRHNFLEVVASTGGSGHDFLEVVPLEA